MVFNSAWQQCKRHEAIRRLYSYASNPEPPLPLHARGVFGCHTALVIRRLRRVCARCYDVHPTFVVTSATVANPQQHVSNLLGARRCACTSCRRSQLLLGVLNTCLSSLS